MALASSPVALRQLCVSCAQACCGKAPGPIKVEKITKDGGKFIQQPDGRIVEYFLYGSEDPSARVLVQCPGSMATGYHNTGLPKLCAKLKELNIRGVSVSMAGYGFTSWRSDFRLCDYAVDVEAVLKAEGITGPLMVEGASYGAGLAAAVAHRFGERCTHLHVRAFRIPGIPPARVHQTARCRCSSQVMVPYIPHELRQELGFTGIDLKGQDDACLDKDSAYFDSCGSCCTHCCCFCQLCCLLRCCPGVLADEGTKKTEAEAPGFYDNFVKDVRRCGWDGANAYGVAHNIAGGLISRNWGFDLKELKTKAVMISYCEGDLQCPTAHAKWLIDHFEKAGAKASDVVGVR